MNLIPVSYVLKVGKQDFVKQVFVNFIPSVGTYLKIFNFSFVVREIEQDLDSYHDRFCFNGMSCESVRAEINESCHDENDCLIIVENLLQNGWTKRMRAF